MKNPVTAGYKFLSETRAEIGKTTWPNRLSILAGTLSVFLVSAVMMAYIFGSDFLIMRIISFIVK